jgi:hypothetical protein
LAATRKRRAHVLAIAPMNASGTECQNEKRFECQNDALEEQNGICPGGRSRTQVSRSRSICRARWAGKPASWHRGSPCVRQKGLISLTNFAQAGSSASSAWFSLLSATNLGARRKNYPLPFLQVMGSSGLFEAWRVIQAGALVWFYEETGGN